MWKDIVWFHSFFVGVNFSGLAWTELFVDIWICDFDTCQWLLSCYLCLSLCTKFRGLRARVTQWVRSLELTTHTNLSPTRRGFAPGFVNYRKGCTWLAAASDKVYQLLAHGKWFSPGTPASSTTKIGCHDIAEILPKVAWNTIN